MEATLLVALTIDTITKFSFKGNIVFFFQTFFYSFFLNFIQNEILTQVIKVTEYTQINT